MTKTEDWNAIISVFPGAHFLQTRQWGEVKTQFGWDARYYLWQPGEQNPLVVDFDQTHLMPGSQINAAAMVLRRTIHFAGLSFRMLYLPKGPLLDWSNQALRKKILDDLVELARREGAIFIKIDPDTSFYTGVPTSNTDATYDPVSQDVVADLRQAGWCYSNEQIQFRNTVVIDLNQPEQLILANMKQKTRYNIHLAERKGVQIRAGSVQDIPLLYQMYAETSVRDKFVIRDQRYYQVVWEKFIRSGLAQVLIAEVNNEPVAGLILFVFAKKAWYLYGMSRQVHREKMPNHLLQWEAIRVSRAQGCEIYDLWGAPEHFDESDPMWGVYRFKEGLGGKVVRHIGAWDLPIQPNLYKFSMQILPKILAIHRRRGMDRTRHQASI